MAGLKLFPVSGINNVSNDDALQQGGDNPKLYVKDAINVDITDTGRVRLRNGAELVTELNFKNIWQSPLHQDVFATLNGQLVKLDPLTWNYDVLESGINDSIVCYEIINNHVFIATQDKIYRYDGLKLQALGIDTPAAPIAQISEGGTLGHGEYTIAISYSRGGLESGLSESIKCVVIPDNSNIGDSKHTSIRVTFPYVLDQSVTHVNLYVTTRNGMELRKFATYPVQTYQAIIDQCDSLGKAAQFVAMSAMPSGLFLKYWQGRLVTALKNILRFSQAMAYHIHDERHDFVMLPQRITFLLPVDGGIWVGQVDHVVFLSGNEPNQMSFSKKSAHAPVPYSAIEVESDLVGGDISQGGAKTALWLSENGYVMGTSTGQIIELHAGVIKGLSAKAGRSVRLDRRVTTLVS
ncbi:hypothetical protein [Acinetobacter ursingii]|uniref:hypothetical protein n=1 Tax=Acinetobacter ursingii TaxID=108980 RepID=UPI0021CD7F8F|nr:hypothetical protein [Acinetobacter ursingii]MCU4350228.1 hypothetical protein [Acinetobacter ursingii]